MPWMQELLSVSLREIMVKKEILLLAILLISSFGWGCIDSPGDGVKVLTVGASDCQGHVADFSGSGPTRDGRTKPDVVAPGVDVISTVPPDLKDIDYLTIYYAKSKGTSLSTPAAAGVSALLLQADGNLTPAGVKAAMMRGATKLKNTQGEEYEEYYQGAGLIDAYGSYLALNGSLCGVEPTRWYVGRWAFISGGKAISPGLETGADRLQKKLYALAPADQDWTTKFVFFTDVERRDLNMTANGETASWTILQPIPREMPANGQIVFGATITVPKDAAPGLYRGTIDISDAGQVIYSIPVKAQVAGPLEIVAGRGTKPGSLLSNQWDYSYIDVPLGTDQLKARLIERPNSNLDLFLLAPTSEYYRGDGRDGKDEVAISTPPSGRWLLAVHSRESQSPQEYTLEVQRSGLESNPRRWNVGSLAPGQVKTAQLVLGN
jgi:hypothetical protein